MASINSQALKLTTVDTNTTVNVTYKAVFSSLERRLAGLGLQFIERITVLGVDPGVSDKLLATFQSQYLPVTAGDPSQPSSQIIARDRSITVPRAILQEDPAIGDEDEIRCSISIEPVGMPTAKSALTEIKLLLG